MTLRLHDFSATAMQTTVDINSFKIDRFPQEISRKIFSYLSVDDLHSCSLVSRTLNISVKSAANINEINSIKIFINTIIKKLDLQEHSELIKKIKDIEQKIIFYDFSNLKLLKEYILDIKNKLISEIKVLEEGILSDLIKDVKMPHFFENFLGIFVIERQIDGVFFINNERERCGHLRDISEGLVRLGFVERAIEVAESIPCENDKWSAFVDISKTLAQLGKIEKAIDFTANFIREKNRWFALWDISKVLTKSGEIEKAVKVALSIPDENNRWFVLWDCSQFLSQMFDFNKAIYVVNMIANENRRWMAFLDISHSLIEFGDINKALEIAELIGNEDLKKSTISGILKSSK